MVPISPPNISKVNHHMLWMGIWIHHHALSTDSCRSRFGKSAEILGHCLVVYEALVHWLRLQTHIEWFSHPL